ncbi:MAG: hypothetical protein JST76_04440 [Bacteroidetes bacterium]|nr:hypothetical protein [Bacteroidota bacterium]
MKSLLIIALTLVTFAAKAQTPAAKETTKATIANVANTAVETPAATTPAATEATPAQDATAGTGPHISANFVGTNDLNLLLLREGVKKA